MTAPKNKSGDSEHPWVSGRYEMHRLFGDLAERRRAWMIVALTSAAAGLVLAAGMVTLVITRESPPYIVEVDSLGELHVVGEIARQDPPERVLRATLIRVLKNIRAIPTDVNLLNALHAEALAHLDGSASDIFRHDILASHDELKRMLSVGEWRMVTGITSMTALPGLPEMYRVTWTEKHASRRGAATAAYEGHFRVRTLAVKDPTAVILNPLGIYITDYTIAKIALDP